MSAECGRASSAAGSGTPYELTSCASLGLYGPSRIRDADDACEAAYCHEHGADHHNLVESLDRLVVRGKSVSDERACNDDADHGHADQPGNTGDGVVDRGRDTRVTLVGIGEHGRDEGCDSH